MTTKPPRSKGRTGRPWRRMRQLVLERDQWTCQICYQPIPRDVPYPSPHSAAVDHLVPISMGGAPLTMSNLRASHMACNSSRGAGRDQATVLVAATPVLMRCVHHNQSCAGFHSRAW